MDAGLWVVGAELVAFTVGYARSRRGAVRAGTQPGWPPTGWCCSAINPWTWWSVSFDFHAESPGHSFHRSAGLGLANGRRRAWAGSSRCCWLRGCRRHLPPAWGSGSTMCGTGAADRAGAVMAGLGRRRGSRHPAIHGNLGSGHGLQSYDYLAAPGYPGVTDADPSSLNGLATHPGGGPGTRCGPSAWTSGRISAPSGLLGMAFLPLLPIYAGSPGANNLSQGLPVLRAAHSSTLPLYVLLPAGTVAVLAWLARRRHQDGPGRHGACSWPRRSAGPRYGRRGQCRPVGARAFSPARRRWTRVRGRIPARMRCLRLRA